MDIYRCPLCGHQFSAPQPGLYRCPSCQKEVEVKKASLAEVPWDKKESGDTIGAFFSTIKSSMLDPVSFFEAVGKGEGLVRPLIYAIVISFIVFIVAAAYQAGFQVLEVAPQIASSIRNAIFPIAVVSGPLALLLIGIIGIIGVPIATALGLLIEAAFFHLGLILLGSAKRSFSATFRTVCYCMGPHILQIIPILGGMISGIWVVVLCVIGVKTVHETTYPRSAFAVFLPLILCCGVMILFLATIAGGVFAALIAK